MGQTMNRNGISWKNWNKASENVTKIFENDEKNHECEDEKESCWTKRWKKNVTRTSVIRARMAILFDIIYNDNYHQCAQAKIWK